MLRTLRLSESAGLTRGARVAESRGAWFEDIGAALVPWQSSHRALGWILGLMLAWAGNWWAFTGRFPLLWLAPPLAFLGARFIGLGMLGTVIGPPRCAKCGYERPNFEPPPVCPECGSDWRAHGGTVTDTPVRNPWMIGTGIALSVGAVVMVLWPAR